MISFLKVLSVFSIFVFVVLPLAPFLLSLFPSVGGKQAAINEPGRVKEHSDVEKNQQNKKKFGKKLKTETGL